MPDARARKHFGMRRSERSATEDHHTRLEKFLLPVAPDLGKKYLSTVTLVHQRSNNAEIALPHPASPIVTVASPVA